jgi:hypothetical protein
MLALTHTHKQVKISIQYGHVAHTSLLYVWYGWVACAIPKQVRHASRFLLSSYRVLGDSHTHTHVRETVQ